MVSRTFIRNFSNTARLYCKNFVQPHMNELPVPCGDWQTLHNARQKKYNTVLATGVVFLAFSIYVGRQTGALYLNFSPPESID